eukprot:TRINITY_DN8912_c0_g1_i1.p1 TRINITY_DN8912_c0_g1~~TRINITY_DN8912_c0_g1_i1.p1  ORF type:complete len:213 (+),score=43.20 TRINITY_DN8912_c0_g1_i1:39-677(+)
MTSHQQTCDHLVKLCLAGSSTVGKSAICQMLSTGQFQKDLPSTIGVDFCIKTLNIDDRNVKMQVWDTAGQERFRSITNSYYRGASGVMIVYDVSNDVLTEMELESWLTSVQAKVSDYTQLMIVGNKADLKQEGSTPQAQLLAEALARRHQIPHFVITAKDEAQVLSAFKELTTMCLAFRSAEAPSIANCDRQIKWHTPNTQTTYWDSYCTLL